MKGRKREETREYRGEQLDFYGRQIIKEAVDPSGVLKSPQRKMYRVAQNHGEQVLRISHTILSFLEEIASASQQLPFFTRSAQLPLL